MGVDDIKIRDVGPTVETEGTIGDPVTLVDALHGPYFTLWACYRRIILVWDQLELFSDHADLGTTSDLPKSANTGAHHVITSACNGLFQVSDTRMGDRFGVSKSSEALYVKEIQKVLVDLTGDVEDVVVIVLDACARRGVPVLDPVAPMGRDIFPYRLEYQILRHLRRVFTHDD